MVEMHVTYEDFLHCRVTHCPSVAVLSTDAPKDNMGLGESFSPTDLVAAALASCMLTVMGIVAARHKIDLKGASVSVLKEMTREGPRRIETLAVTLTLPAGLTSEQRDLLEKTALACPVHKSLHPDIEVPLDFVYR